MLKNFLLFFYLGIILFQWHSCFSLVCKEYTKTVEGKWRVDKDSWNHPEADSLQQLSNSIDIVYATLFQSPSQLEVFPLTPEERARAWYLTQQKFLFLRRLYLVLGLSNLQYTDQDNGLETCPWPFPLATALTQGQRIMIILKGISGKDFLKFLSGSSEDIYYKRPFSSHAVRYRRGSNTFYEVKMPTSFQLFKGRQGNLGIDLPWGGIGNALPNGNLVYTDGQQFDLTTRLPLKNHQLGHLLIYWHDFPSLNTSVLLIGLEGCAPGTVNIFGCNHNILSGFADQKVRRSSTGGLKWSGLKIDDIDMPAEYGGKRIEITSEIFAWIENKVKDFLSYPEMEQSRIFKNILTQNSTKAHYFLKTYIAGSL